LNADPSVQLRLLDVQALDVKLDQLAHRRATVPEAQTARELAAEHQGVTESLGATETELADLGREQRKAEADVEQVRSRRERDEKRLQAGQVGSPRDLENLQHEIESLIKRQSDLEDTELEVMERLEEAGKRQQEQSARQAELAGKLAEAEASRDAAYAQIDAELESTRTERSMTAEGIGADLLSLYEKRRVQFGGVGAAALKNRRCDGCRMEINASDLQRFAQSPPELVLRCEECGRILVRTPQSGLPGA
jgi:predicted  nucleic acid-binding Zn-ribbon protein